MNDSRSSTDFWRECNTGGYIPNSTETMLMTGGATVVAVGVANVLFPKVAIPIKAAVTTAYTTRALTSSYNTAKECHK